MAVAWCTSPTTSNTRTSRSGPSRPTSLRPRRTLMDGTSTDRAMCISTTAMSLMGMIGESPLLCTGRTLTLGLCSVSFKPNTTFSRVENMYCNGSHGISVGSLGKCIHSGLWTQTADIFTGQYAYETDIVSDIYVRNISMNNAQNGARIKVFPGSNDTNSISGGGTGYVRNITFEDFVCNSKSKSPVAEIRSDEMGRLRQPDPARPMLPIRSGIVSLLCQDT